jgi:hypothetical protein
VFGDVPARAAAPMWEQGAGTGHILLGAKRVDLILNFVRLARNCEKADAVNRAGGGAQIGELEAKLVPCEVREVNEECQNKKRRE